MSARTRLKRSFYNRPTLTVARALLGQRLVRVEAGGQRTAGRIIETEAYVGTEDLGCHAASGRTARNETMWGAPGHAYVYFVYGMHWMLNFVTEEEGFPAAVLLRAIEPLEGIERIQSRRAGRPQPEWTDGPGKLCKAFGIDGSFDGLDLCSPSAALFIERDPAIPDQVVTTDARVGLYSVDEPWRSMPWRFRIRSDYLH